MLIRTRIRSHYTRAMRIAPLIYSQNLTIALSSRRKRYTMLIHQPPPRNISKCGFTWRCTDSESADRALLPIYSRLSKTGWIRGFAAESAYLAAVQRAFLTRARAHLSYVRSYVCAYADWRWSRASRAHDRRSRITARRASHVPFAAMILACMLSAVLATSHRGTADGGEKGEGRGGARQ